MLDEVAIAHRILLRVMQAISTDILYGSSRAGAVPAPQFDQFEHLELRSCQERLQELGDFWRSLCNERDQWLKQSIDFLKS